MPSAHGTDKEPAELHSPRDPRTWQPSDPGAPSAVLAAERAHLRESRSCLRRMRENVLSLKALGGDPISEEYLKADLYRRAEALRDIPGVPLFFGRLDYVGPPAERLHIGRRHVHDAHGQPMVIDWRAPLARAFYRATPATPMGLSLRRRFGFAGGVLTAYEDEDFTAGPADGTASAATSRILIEEIERPRVGPMRDIVATIQPDQDDIVRADADRTVAVQGAPGTGKTAVGLHRVAYLLYAHSERMRRGGVLVVGPNRAFLGYIRDVLPALGEVDVSQLTIAELTGAALPAPVRARLNGSAKYPDLAAPAKPAKGRPSGIDANSSTDDAARIKGDARMAEVLRRALWSHLAAPAEPVVVPRGARRWRVAAHEIMDQVAELRSRDVRYGAGRDLLAHRIAHVILTRMEESGYPCDDRTHDSVRRSRPVKAAVDAIWPPVDPVRLVMRLLSDPAMLAAAADGVLSAAEQDAIRWPVPPRSLKSAPWCAADAVIVDEAKDLIDRTPSLSHVVIDEAQDLSPMQCRAIGRRCATGSATVLGDVAQGTTPWASSNWLSLLRHLGKLDADMRVLSTGYRVPRQIIDYASRLLPCIAPGLAPAGSVRQSPGSLRVVTTKATALGERVANLSRNALLQPGTVAVIGADDHVPALARSLHKAYLPHMILGAGTELPHEAGRAIEAGEDTKMDGFVIGGEGGASGAGGGGEPAGGGFRDRAAGPAGLGGGADAGRGADATGGADAGRGADATGGIGGEGAGRTAGDARARLVIVPVTLAKGLEFDHVIVVEPARIANGGDRVGLRRLYVALTRAVSRLCVLHAEPLPEPLR